jgi:Uncharacterized protein conserved in bacteria (DUF2188)
VKRMDVVKKNDQWRGESQGRAVPGTSAPRKEDAVKKTAQKARANPEAVTVKIHKVTGGIQEERTYPRKADPRKRKG